ncbi:Hypothetical protein NTJ_09764 [Nesidiocoris tenuis]|uniref:Polycystin domain-containing protein n=1 Tax=Nesidiocoris tenuis TaxID=355587 RepID=A0ABN7AXP1_9HEMI|nr:Hypothetical protein NTJ_09764 [Nesidiocoris tenuis]
MKRKKQFSVSSTFSYKPEVSTADDSDVDTPSQPVKAAPYSGPSKASDSYLIKDIIFYICQLALVIIINFETRDYTFNHYSAMISDVVVKTHFESDLGVMKKFEDIRSPDQIWEFTTGVFTKLLYRGVSGNQSKILAENILVGVPRMRQLRVKMNTCEQAALFDEFYKTCFDYFREEIEDKEPFGLKTDSWIYKEPDANERIYHGHFGAYDGGGYQFEFSRNSRETWKGLRELQDNVWIRYGTRAVFLDFAIYSANANLLCVVKLLFELIPTGGVISSSRLFALKLFLFSSLADYLVLICELVFLFLTIYLIFLAVVRACKSKKNTFRKNKKSKLLDYSILAMSLLASSAGLTRYVVLTQFQMKHKADLVNSTAYRNFDFMIQLQKYFCHARCALLVALLIKMLTFLSLFKSVNLILSAFGKVKSELVTVTIMMFAIMTGFVVFGLIVFGDHVVQLYSVWSGLFTMLSLHVGGLYFYEEPEYASPKWAPIYFSAYILLVKIMYCNAFVALMIYGYDKAVKASVEDPSPHFIIRQVDAIFKFFLAKIKRYDLVRLREMDEIIRKNAADYDALQLILRKHGWTTLEINLVFKKYGVVRGDDLSIETMSEIYDDAHARNQLFIESDSHFRIAAEMEKVEKMLEHCDQTMVDIMSKIDILMDKTMKKEVGKKR